MAAAWGDPALIPRWCAGPPSRRAGHHPVWFIGPFTRTRDPLYPGAEEPHHAHR
jgi:hypothetical protein